MLINEQDPRLVLFEAADIDADPAVLQKQLVGQGLPDTADVALREILGWARSYLARPHPELGRSGDVCPFTRPALDRGTFYLTVYPGEPRDPAEVVEVLAGYREWFSRLDPTEHPLAQFKTILALFPGVPAESAPEVIDSTQALLKPAYVENGLMIGEFHDGPPDQGGLWNPDWRPLRSPVPLLAIRHMVPTDCLFLEHDADLLRSYLEQFRTQVPKHLRARIDEAARSFGLEPLPEVRQRRAPADPLAGLTPQQKRAMLEELLARDPAQEYPATSPQRRLWFIDRLEASPQADALYTMPGRVRLPANADHGHVEAAFAHVLARHEALRTWFRDDDGEPVGVVAAPHDPRLAVDIPVRHDAEGALRDLLDQPFALDVPPLLRAELLRGTDADQLLLSFHHIVADDASIAQVCGEIRAVYDALSEGRAPELEPVVQFGDYARWVAEQVAEGAYEPHRAYWVGRLSGAPQLLPLPTARPRPAQQSFRGAAHPFRLDGLMAQVDTVARRTASTRFMVLSAALGSVLARLSGSDDVVLGSPVAGRNATGLDTCVGMFVNTVALRTDLSGRPTLEEVLERTKHTVLGALDHQELPFEEVAEEVATTRNLSYNPVFQTMFVLGREDVLGGPVTTTASADEETVARFDLTVVVVDRPDRLEGWIDYSTDLFDAPQIAALTERLTTVVGAMAATPEVVLDDLDVRTAHERDASAVVAATAETDVVTAFLDQARRRPDACAVEVLDGSDQRITYADLERWSARTSARLQAEGVRPGDMVAIDAGRTTGVVAAMLGVLRAGAAYLPLDPGHPTERRAALVADSGAVAVIGEASDLHGLGLPALAYDGETSTMAADLRVPAQASAYVIYTSGSTGTPKGVLVSRQSVADLAHRFVAAHGLRETDRLLGVPPFSFDASVGDLFPALVSGAALVLTPDPAALSLSALTDLAQRHGISAVDTAAPLWQEWVAQLGERPGLGAEVAASPLRMVWFGGDAVPTAAVRTWLRRTGIPVHNHYGPTEATVCATTCPVLVEDDLGAWPTVPVGRPLAGVRIQVLDARLRPVPDGVYGEICIGGAGVAHGYLGRPGQTAARFVPDPGVPGGRMYRTGDIGRWGADGRLEFAGRADDQVKIRGYRIEPGEIEGVLGSHPAVAEAAVTVHDDLATGRRLIAHAVSSVGADELLAHLAERLPEHLVPSQIVLLDRLPRTTGGKLDRSALAPPLLDEPAREHVAPSTPTERAVADIWRELLEVEEVSASDGYFDLGGHSLLAGRVLARLQAACGVDVPLRLLFAAPDLRAFAADIDRVAVGEQPVGEQVDFAAEARLPGDLTIRPTTERGAAPKRPLLTGATGFVGAHLLAELLPRCERVFCLVRADSVEHGRDRLRSVLADHDLLEESLLDRIVVVPGDLGRSALGMRGDEHARLAQAIDGIFHVAAQVSSAHSYRQLAPTNVAGTLEVLRLSAAAGVPLHDVSTLGVFRTPSYDDAPVRESTPLPDDPDGIVGAYEQSKWVGDRLVTSARDRGLDVTVHRPARVAGSTRTGAVPAADFLPLLLQAVVELGSVPVMPGWQLDLTPVDHLVAAIARLAAQSPGTYHYLTTQPLAFGEVVGALQDVGFDLDERDPEAWYDDLVRVPSDRSAGYAVLAQELSGNAVRRAEPRFDCAATEDAVRAVGLAVPTPRRDWIRRYVEFLIASGTLPQPTESQGSPR